MHFVAGNHAFQLMWQLISGQVAPAPSWCAVRPFSSLHGCNQSTKNNKNALFSNMLHFYAVYSHASGTHGVPRARAHTAGLLPDPYNESAANALTKANWIPLSSHASPWQYSLGCCEKRSASNSCLKREILRCMWCCLHSLT